MTPEAFNRLFEKWLLQQMTDEELNAFLSAATEPQYRSLIEEALDKEFRNDRFDGVVSENQRRVAYELLLQQMGEVKPRSVVYRLNRWKWVAAAVLILIAVTAVTMWLTHHPARQDQALAKVGKKPADDVLPGGNKAILTLGNGRQIILDSTRGSIVQQGDLKVVNSSGSLAYEGKGDGVEYHTLSTPRGGQYKLQLPDGTEVWLNAASSIVYPTVFTGNQRNVTITGEAYFEVVHNAKQPFRVHINFTSGDRGGDGGIIEDLGTRFNINAYTDEKVARTTLLEGSVKITRGTTVQQLAPGEQAVIKDGIQVVHDADMDQVMAWKNGIFNFNHADLPTVMRQLERWYDIKVQYEGHLPPCSFHGKITRDLNLSQVLRVLQDVDVKFRIEGKTVILTP